MHNRVEVEGSVVLSEAGRNNVTKIRGVRNQRINLRGRTLRAKQNVSTAVARTTGWTNVHNSLMSRDEISWLRWRNWMKMDLMKMNGGGL